MMDTILSIVGIFGLGVFAGLFALAFILAKSEDEEDTYHHDLWKR